MLIKLTPEQVSGGWPVIKETIEYSLAPVVGESEEKMNNILMSLLNKTMQCWVATKDNKYVAVVTTKILYDDSSLTKSLLVYSIYASGTEESVWISSFETLRKYAISKGCSRIVGYTDNVNMIKLAERLGGEARYTLVSMPLGVAK